MALDGDGSGVAAGRLQFDGRQPGSAGYQRVGLLAAAAVGLLLGLAACNMTIGSPEPDVRESDSDGMSSY